MLLFMGELTVLLAAIDRGDPHAANRLLPLVYDELRRFAAQKLSQERPGQTLQATALVHEAYLRLVDENQQVHWDSRGHFFAAAAEAMRRILVENARRKKRLKRGGGRLQLELAEHDLVVNDSPDDMLLLDECLAKLAADDVTAAEVAKLRLFTGISVEETAKVLDLSRATAYRHWTYARAWLRCEIKKA